MPKNWTTSQDPHGYLKKNNDKIQVGDTITYISGNVMDEVQYEVIIDEAGKKALNKLSGYVEIDFLEEEPDAEEGESSKSKKGGRRKRKTRRYKKTKRNKKVTRRMRQKIKSFNK